MLDRSMSARLLIHRPELGDDNPSALMVTAEDCYSRLLAEFPVITMPSFNQEVVPHGVQHRITTNCAPIRSKARRLPPDKLEAVKAESTL